MKDPNRMAKTVMSAITKTHTPSTPGSRRVGPAAGTSWWVSELITALLINTSLSDEVTGRCRTTAEQITPAGRHGWPSAPGRARRVRTSVATLSNRAEGAATNLRTRARRCRSGRESRRPRGPAIHRRAAVELVHAPTNILDQIGAGNYFPAQPAEVREVVAHDAIPGERAGLQNAGEARREEADRAEDGEVAHPVRHERRGLVLPVRQNCQGERHHLQRGARILQVDDQPAGVGQQLNQRRVPLGPKRRDGPEAAAERNDLDGQCTTDKFQITQHRAPAPV